VPLLVVVVIPSHHLVHQFPDTYHFHLLVVVDMFVVVVVIPSHHLVHQFPDTYHFHLLVVVDMFAELESA
jgi:hypothetical protein